ncbi:hypothetical protein C0995_014035 [Termitomyces sp. Mi166|nr:hypothetical protein C0995_014035 [Termitomyces sp. Mi166\
MSSPSASKSKWARVGGVVRRASMVLAPVRANTPERERDSDTSSLKGSVRSIPINQPSVLLPPKVVASIPSPIAESPVQQIDSNVSATTVEPSPLAQAPTASEPQAVASPVQEYTPPPLINSTAVGPGGFTDDPDDLPKSQTIRDPSQLQPDSTDEHEPPAPVTEPTTTAGPGGFNDSDDLPQPQTIKASSPQRTYSAESHKPSVVEPTASRGFIDDDLPETKITQAPSLERTESVDSHKPQVVSSSTVGLGGFNDNLDDDLPQSKVIKETALQELDTKVEPVPQTTQPLMPTNPLAEPSTPVREFTDEPTSYFDLPIITEPEPHPEATEEFKKQIENVFPSLPTAETPQEANPPIASRDEPFQSLQEMPAPVQAPATPSDMPSEMPTPDPVAHPSLTPGLPPFESNQEAWRGVAHPRVEETKKDTNTAASTRSRASSTRSVPTEDPFADPIAPRITVSHHDQSTPPAMPQPKMSDPYPQAPASQEGDSGVIFMPLPPMHEVIPPRSVYDQSNQTLSNTMTGYYDTDERLPLLPQASSSKVTSYLQPSAASHNIVNVSPQSGVPPASTWSTQATHQGPRLSDFGWIEYRLPDGTVYYVHPTRRVTADIDLRDDRRLDAINAYFERHGEGASAPAGLELWFREDGVNDGRRLFCPPLRFLVNHGLKMATFDQSSVNGEAGGSGRAKKVVEDDQLDIEYRYWSFMEAHPAHATLPPNARAEAMDVLTWAWTDRLLPAHHPVPAPFTQEECQELTSLLRSFGELSGANNISALTDLFRPTLAIITLFQGDDALSDVLFSTSSSHVFAWGSLTSSSSEVADPGSTKKVEHRLNPSRLFLFKAAIVLSASVTFLCLPGLDNFARIAGFVTILLSTFSMVSALVALFRWKTEMDNPISHVAGEGLMRLTRRSVIMALPVIFLVYAIIAFVTGIVLYSFWGTTTDTLSQHPFADCIKWTVIGVLGGLGGMLFTSLLLFGR